MLAKDIDGALLGLLASISPEQEDALLDLIGGGVTRYSKNALICRTFSMSNRY